MVKQSKKNNSAVRIIAGRWRGRKIYFNDCDGIIRPTADRVRETVFNWLSAYIIGANCLDLYAGSGILSFEALSRQATKVVAIEQHAEVCQNICKTKELLGIGIELQLLQTKVELWLADVGQPFDIIFLDPPYSEQALSRCFQWLNDNNWTKDGSLIYYEHNSVVQPDLLPQTWSVMKAKKAGQVHYYLAQVKG